MIKSNDTTFKNTFYCLVCLVLFSQNILFSQTQNPVTINLSAPDSGNKTYVAQEEINFLPGYDYADNLNSMYAYIQPHTQYHPLFSNTSFSNTNINTNLEVGYTSGSHSVGLNGAATYQVPILLPQGTNGMMPNLSVGYSSQSGDGVLGMGWNLEGLSTISVVQSAWYSENETENVSLDGLDRFAIDGNRLFSLNGQYGSDATVYSTEVESYIRITSYGWGTNPDWFKVETKEGVTMEYGRTSDSRIIGLDGSTSTIWHVSKVYDTHGNYMEFKYRNENKDVRIDEIRYSGNFNTGTTPYNLIKFNYETRNDNNQYFTAGTELRTNYLLNKVDIYSEGEHFKSYQFEYGFDHYSLLTSITELGANNEALNPTIFQYGTSGNNFETATTSSLSIPYTDLEVARDFNGDGLSDILVKHFYYDNTPQASKIYTNWEVFISNGGADSFSHYASGAIPFGYYMFFDSNNDNIKLAGIGTSLDFYGDGADDILLVKYTASGNGYTLSNFKIIDINGVDQVTEYTPTPYSGLEGWINPSKFLHIGDFDGDGRDDIMWFRYGSQTNFNYSGKLITAHSGEKDISVMMGLEYLQSAYKILPSDFDGDGKEELTVLFENSCEIFEIKSQQVGGTYHVQKIYHSANPGFPTRWHRIIPGDFNGDGKTDILTTGNDINWVIGYSTGTNYITKPFTFQDTPNLSSSSESIRVGDFNGDGKTDIMHASAIFQGLTATSSKIDMYYSRGDVFVSNSFPINLITSYDDFVIGDFNGDGKSNVFNRDFTTQPASIYSFHKNEKQFLLHKIKDGFGRVTTFNNSWLTQIVGVSNVTAVFPLTSLRAAVPVVESVTIPDGIGGQISTSYFFSGTLWHRQGKGFIGFSKVESENYTTGIKNILEYELNYNFKVLRLESEENRLISTNELISRKTLINNVIGLGGVRHKTNVIATLEEDILNTISIQTNLTYDNYGNKLTIERSNGVETILTTNQYSSFGTWWIPSRLTSTNVTTTRTGELAFTRTRMYSYNFQGAISQETSDPGTAKSVTKNFQYDLFGNRKEVNTSSSGLQTLTTTMNYDIKGRFVVSTTNPLNQTVQFEYGKKWAEPVKVISISGQINLNEFDGFGNLISSIDTKGNNTVQLYSWDLSSNISSITAPINTIYNINKIKPGEPSRKVWYDIINREVKSQVEGLSGTIISVSKFDERGNALSTTSPFFSGELPILNVNSYDVYNRLANINNAISSTSYTYSSNGGNRVVNIQEPSQTTTKIIDASGYVISASDELGTMNYAYFSNGLQKEVSLNGTVMASTEYDEYKRQNKLIDINAGTTEYEYNAFGQLISQTDANGDEYQMVYDALGREITKTGPNGVTVTSYVLNGQGLNNIKKVTDPNGTFIEYEYDEFDRIIEENKSIEGISYITNYQYDELDKVISMTYPSGYVIEMNYDSNGYLIEVTNSGGQYSIFNSPIQNSRGQVENYILGDGVATYRTYNNLGFLTSINASGIQDYEVSFNPNSGNLTFRMDYLKNRIESFDYDEGNRLIQSKVSSITNPLLAYEFIDVLYADNGNILEKTGLGAYSYDNQKINAVISVENVNGWVSTDQQDIVYTNFDRTASINEGNNFMSFTYGPLLNRAKSEFYLSNNLEKTKYYVGSYEKEITSSGTREIHYIPTTDGYCAAYVIENGIGTYYFFYKDHLGTIVAVTNENSLVEFEQNFDAWGRRRNAQTWAYGSVSVPNNFSWIPGFTGHEQLDQFGLINMNNRMYDPALGRMLAVDNFIQNPFLSQHFNRYSYALNNPLIYTDATGEIVQVPIIIGAVIGTYMAGTLANNGNPNPFEWNFSSGRTWGYMLAGAVVGGLSAGIGAAISSSGIAFANTVAIVASSSFYTVGTALYTAGATDVSINFGFGSYNLRRNEFGYLGKKGNSFGENFGYTLGAIANLGDLLAGFNPSEITLRTENDPSYNFNGKTGWDPIGHSQTTKGTEVLIDWGPKQSVGGFFTVVPGTNSYEHGALVANVKGGKFWDAINIVGVNEKSMRLYKQMLDNGGQYNLLFNSCVSQTSRSLNLSGVFNIGILPGINHPYWLHAQMYLRSISVRPMLFSHYLND